MRYRRNLTLSSGALLALVVIGIVFRQFISETDPTSPESFQEIDRVEEEPSLKPSPHSPGDPEEPDFVAEVPRPLRAIVGPDLEPKDIDRLLDEARKFLRGLPREEAVTDILDFLESGQDVETGLRFRVGPDGILRSPPTLRVAVLDWLGEIDPDTAATYAENIFRTSDSADEWAVSLRNYGRSVEPGSDPYFDEVVREFVLQPEWRQNPTGGYAEGFDAIVFNRQTELLPELAGLHREGGALGRLGAVVLDNYIRSHREEGIAHVLDHPELFHGPSNLRATLVARADPRSETQIGWMEGYLLDPRIPSPEKQVFLEHFPHFSGFHAHRLLTRDAILSLHEQARIDRAALEQVRAWRADSRFGEFESTLQAAEVRLQGFVDSAARGGFVDEPENQWQPIMEIPNE